MSEIEIMQALLMRLRFEQNLGLGYIPRNKQLTEVIKKKQTEQLNLLRTEAQKLANKANSSTNNKISGDKADNTDSAGKLPKIEIVVSNSGVEPKTVTETVAPQNSNNEKRFIMLSPEEKETKMQEVVKAILRCDKCPILADTRDKIVPGQGNVNSPLMFIGEAPGGDENREGIPFIGRAGKKLTEIIEKGMKIPRTEVYITNVLKCRPPQNRNPQPDEIENCQQLLRKQIEIINPRIIFALGAYAARFLLDKPSTFPLAKIRGTLHQYKDTKILVAATYHPSYLIQYYTKENRQKVFEDTQLVMKYLQDELIYPWW